MVWALSDYSGPFGVSGYIWLDTKICYKIKINKLFSKKMFVLKLFFSIKGADDDDEGVDGW